MPAFDLPIQELDALAALVHALNAPAAESTVPGDSVAGERFFFGKGQCASCHMVHGKGKPMGPDISNVGREMRVDQIRGAVLQPSARITPGYELVTVRLRDGRTLRGFAGSRSNLIFACRIGREISPASGRPDFGHPGRKAIADATGEGKSGRVPGSDRLPQPVDWREARSACAMLDGSRQWRN